MATFLAAFQITMAHAQANIVFVDVVPDRRLFDEGEPITLDGAFVLANHSASSFANTARLFTFSANGQGGILVTPNSNRAATLLSFGDPIGPGGVFLGNVDADLATTGSLFNNDAEWLSDTSPVMGYAGFQTQNSGFYGWLLLEVAPSNAADPIAITLKSYAYQTNGNTILAGQVPEPSSLAIVALGGLVVASRRRTRTIESTQNP